MLPGRWCSTLPLTGLSPRSSSGQADQHIESYTGVVRQRKVRYFIFYSFHWTLWWQNCNVFSPLFTAGVLAPFEIICWVSFFFFFAQHETFGFVLFPCREHAKFVMASCSVDYPVCLLCVLVLSPTPHQHSGKKQTLHQRCKLPLNPRPPLAWCE